MNSKIHELDEHLAEFIQLCNNPPTAKLLDYIGAGSDETDGLEGPINTDSADGDFGSMANLLDSARTQPRSPTKPKLQNSAGTLQ